MTIERRGSVDAGCRPRGTETKGRYRRRVWEMDLDSIDIDATSLGLPVRTAEKRPGVVPGGSM